jgi:hypothetical protein
MKRLTFKILSRHLIIGALVTVFVYWTIGEIPYLEYFLDKLHIWLPLPFVLTLSTWLTSTTVYRQLTEKKRNMYFTAFFFIFFSWTILFLSTAISDGLLSSIRHHRFEIFDAIEGYAIYQLWFYWGVAIIHGLIGGIFLAIDLKNNFKVVRQTTNSKFVLTSWEDYWKIFDQLIDLLEASNQTDIISEFKQAQNYVNGLTDGWHDFKLAFEKSLKANRHNLTEEQIYIADFLLDEVNKSLKNR